MKNLGLTTCALLISMLAIPWAGAEGNKVQKPNEKTYDETYVTGEHRFWIDPEDPFQGGFFLR